MDHQQDENDVDVTTAPIERLDRDCCSKIFEYLSLREINHMSQVSLWLKDKAGQHVLLYTPGACKEIYVDDKSFSHDDRDPDHLNGLTEYIGSLYVCFAQDATLKPLTAVQFASVQILTLYDMTEQHHFDSISDILSKIQTLKIMNVADNNNDWFGRLIRECSQLQYLELSGECELEDTWLQEQYPNLRSVAIDTIKFDPKPSGSSIMTLLTNNQTITRFVIDSNFIWTNRGQFEEAIGVIKLDTLVVEFCFHRLGEKDENDWDFEGFRFVLETLGNGQFFQNLHVQNTLEEKLLFVTIAKLDLRTITALNIRKEISTDISEFVYLKELRTTRLNLKPNKLETLAKSLKQLCTICLKDADIHGLLPFFRYTKTLKYFFVVREANDSPWVLELRKLNEARLKLQAEASQTSVVRTYLNEIDYLATKNVQDIDDFDFVILRRIERYRENNVAKD